MAKERADVLCVSQGLFESREKAKRAIMAGIVYNENIRKGGRRICMKNYFLPSQSKGWN